MILLAKPRALNEESGSHLGRALVVVGMTAQRLRWESPFCMHVGRPKFRVQKAPWLKAQKD